MDFARIRLKVHNFILFFFLFPNRNNPLALGENNENLPRILQIFGEVFVHDVLSDDETARKRVLSITRQIQVRPPAPARAPNMPFSPGENHILLKRN